MRTARPSRRSFLVPAFAALALVACAGVVPVCAVEAPAGSGTEGKSPDEAGDAWHSLFDGKTLGPWKSTEFGGEGDVLVKDGAIALEFGASLTGVTLDPTALPAGQALPRSNYELRLEAQRVDGTDFFCGLTFPVKDAYCSLIVGGWGGTLVGLSSIDGEDASENKTRLSRAFKKATWYRIAVRVTDERIQAWIDGEPVIDQELKGRSVTIRPEVSLSKPLGICTWETRALLRNLEWRALQAD
jgi:hypothetical protein